MTRIGGYALAQGLLLIGAGLLLRFTERPGDSPAVGRAAS